jgi:uncharacterized glyoxalase superfamily protein PhnB
MIHPKMTWPCINYRDAPAAVDFLTAAFGLVVDSMHRTGDHVEHAELAFPEGGAIMLGSAASDGTPFERLPTGASGVYVVTDNPAGVYKRATMAGANLVRELRDEPHGSSGFVVADLEGNLWSFGTYRGEQR